MCAQVPAVSIIIPAYNHAKWVGQAVDAVLQQTFTDWELIIIDDASQDDTWAAIGAVAAPHPDLNIQTFRHEHNRGASLTLNEGMARAKGEFIAILNSDDVWHPERLQRLHAKAVSESLDFVAAAVDLWDADSQPKAASEPFWVQWYQGLQEDFSTHQDFLRTLLYANFIISTSNFFFRRRVYARLGGFAELRYVHDYEYLLRLCEAGFKAGYLSDGVLLHYRLHGSNTIREKPLAALEENMRLLIGFLPRLHRQFSHGRLSALQFQLRKLCQYTHEEWLTEIHYRLLDKEQALFALVADRDGWVAERDGVIARQAQWVADRDRWIADRDQQINTLQTAIGQQQAVLAEQQRWLADRDQWLRERDGWIRERDKWVAERDTQISQLEQGQAALLNSRSYRLGHALLAPWRLVRERVLPRCRRLSHA